MGIRDDVRRLTRKGHHRPSEAEHARDVARYKFLLRVASRERLEQAHQEAFEALEPDQCEHLFQRLCHDLPEEDRPIISSPAELAHAAVVAQDGDRGYLVRMLRRPGHGVSEGHDILTPSRTSGDLLFAGSMLAPVAATATRSTAVSDSLAAFDHSPEAAQVDPSLFAGPPDPRDSPGHAAWQAGIIP